MGNWDSLSIRDKAELIKVYVKGGILDIPSMRHHYDNYNVLKDGGYAPSKEIKDYIKKTEAFRSNWYNDANGVPTVGYGFTGKYFKEKYPDGMTREEADKEFDRILMNFADSVRRYTPNYDKLSQNQKDALLSYMYNVGPGNYTRKSPKFQQALKDRDWNAVAQHMDIGYNDKRNPGLRKRRDYEREMFLRDAVSTPEQAMGKFDADNSLKSPSYWYDKYMESVGAAPVPPEVGTIARRPEEQLFNDVTPLSSFSYQEPRQLTVPERKTRRRRTSETSVEIPSVDMILSDLYSSLNNFEV